MTDPQPHADSNTHAPVDGVMHRSWRISTLLTYIGIGFFLLLFTLVCVSIVRAGPRVELINKIHTPVFANSHGNVFMTLPFLNDAGSATSTNDWWYRYLGRIKNIQMEDPILNSEDLRVIGGIASINLLRLEVEPGVTDADLHSLSRLHRLTDLSIGESLLITDRGLECLSRIEGLETLALWNASGITPAGIESLSRLPNLFHLILGRAPLDADLLQRITRIETITHLTLTDCALSDDTVEALAALGRVRLTLRNVRMSGAAFRRCGSLTALRSLQVDQPGFLPADAFAGYDEASQLEWITLLNDPAVDDAMLARIAKIQSLTSVQILNCPITDKGLECLYRHPGLKRLSLPNHLSDPALVKLRENLPGARIDH